MTDLGKSLHVPTMNESMPIGGGGYIKKQKEKLHQHPKLNNSSVNSFKTAGVLGEVDWSLYANLRKSLEDVEEEVNNLWWDLPFIR